MTIKETKEYFNFTDKSDNKQYDIKYYIIINQAAVRQISKKLTLKDMAIFDYIYNIHKSGSDKIKRIIYKQREYTWVNYSHLLKQMPLLQCSKASITRAIQRLEKYGLIVSTIHDSNKYIRIGPKSVMLFEKSDTNWDEIVKIGTNDGAITLTEFWENKELIKDAVERYRKSEN